MDCSEFLRRYSDYDDSLISAPEADRFRSHMADCPSCARYDRVLRKGRMMARQIPGPDPSGDFGLRLRARLWEGPRRSTVARRPLVMTDRPGPAGGAEWSARASAAMASLTVLLAASAAFGLLGLSAPDPATSSGTATSVAASFPASLSAGGPLMAGAVDSHDSPVAGRFVDAVSFGVLPPMAGVQPRDWAAKRVDRGPSSSYSPLVTGPPAYRGDRARDGPSIPTHRTLD